LIAFVISAVILHASPGIKTSDFGDIGTMLTFYTALTIPAALYYVGAGIHPSDLRFSELKKLFGKNTKQRTDADHWTWVQNIIILTVVITPLSLTFILLPLVLLQLIPLSWFFVIIINAFLPITSTNMFLIPYGIDKKATAHGVTWTTIICVPIVVCLIYFFSVITL
jgi:hypothetical protein